MNTVDVMIRIAIATAIGLLIGIERGWKLRDAGDGQRVAGIRTYTLIGLSGGICGLIASLTTSIVLGFSLLAFVLPFGLYELRRMRAVQSYSATGFTAALITFLLGAAAVLGDLTIVASAGVLTAVVLAERDVLHGFLQRISWVELRSALLLLVMTVVLLPALPDRVIDPWGALNPFEIWLMTVLIAVVSFAGYISMRLAGPKRGLLYAGLVGGLITSTTVTWTFSRLAKQHPTMRAEAIAAILSAWMVSLLRMGGIAIAVAPVLAGPLLPPLLIGGAVLLVGVLGNYMVADQKGESTLPLKNPFDLGAVLAFGVILIVVMLLGKMAGTWFGAGGLAGLSAISGFVDVDPITLSMAQGVRNGMSASQGAAFILIAASTNGIAKTCLGFVFGGWRLGLPLAAALCIAAVSAGVTIFFQHS